MPDRVLLDYLLGRREVNPFWEKLPLWLIQCRVPFCLAGHQVATIGYLYDRESKRPGLYKRPEARQIWTRFLNKATIVKTPAALEWGHPLAQYTMEDYQIHAAAVAADCEVITSDQGFIHRGPCAA